MLDINLFLEERGGEPELIRESQRRRHESVEIVDEIIALYEDWKTSTSLFFKLLLHHLHSATKIS
jgi:seryl-tRNA synthetase